jgi:uncharacterized protein (DUF885 family)
MKKFVVITCFILVSCNGKEKKSPESQDRLFNGFKANFIERLWRIYPGWASSVGYHRYDSLLIVPTATQREKELKFLKENLDSLRQFELTALSEYNKTDYYLMHDFFNAARWRITTLKPYEWMPSQFNISDGFAELLNNDHDSLELRLKNFYLKMKYVPAYYEAAKKNIVHPTIEHTQLAISQNLGGISIFVNDLDGALKKSKLLKEEMERIRERAKQTVAAIMDYVNWLKKIDHSNARSFRLGRRLYTSKFGYDLQSGYNADQIFSKAFKHKKELHKKMSAITQQLWPKYFGQLQMPNDNLLAIKKMIDTLSYNHVSPDSFQTAIERQIPQLEKFITEKNLITPDTTKPLVVRREPAYMAGLAGASISSPGPYDKNGNTYYNVGSLSGWSAEKATSYLREYNHYVLQILNIHEAVPGHYTQLIYSNRSPSIVKSIFGNGAMVEGWAVYTELMMLENGYGALEGKSESPLEMWLMYYKWNLRSTCNTILDYDVHVRGMTKEQAINLLVNEAFQQQAEAEGKWRRATLSQVQLCSYFTGFTEILDLRETLKKKQGDKFNLKQFHEKFLSYGSAPVKYIRQMMLESI